MIVLILGPQGSGKGTQASFLAKRFGLTHISMGQVLREVAEHDAKIDRLINKEGKLVDNETTFTILKKYLVDNNLEDDIIFDGYPRSLAQLKHFKSWLKEKDKRISQAFLLKISPEETIKRLSGRRLDPATGKIYNLITSPKPGPEVDRELLIQREDDKPQEIRKRLEIYKKVTQPVVEALQKEGVLQTVDGERPISQIQKELSAALEKIKNEKS